MRYARNPEVLWRSTSQGPVVLLGDGEPTHLGGLAAAVWEVLDDEMDAEAVELALRTLAGERLAATGALHELVEAGLVRADAEPAGG